MQYLFYVVAEILANIIAYITNPLICFFANEVGQLPKCFRYWQTYDNPLDVEWMITEKIVPKIFRYNFRSHYNYYYEIKGNGYCIPGYVELINPNFTIKERIQRYFCRLAWMYRNTAYGFSYEVLSKAPYIYNIEILKSYYNNKEEQLIVSHDKTTNWWNKTFKLYYTKPWCKYFYLRVYLGWKLTNDTLTDRNARDHSMLAFFINPFRTRKIH